MKGDSQYEKLSEPREIVVVLRRYLRVLPAQPPTYKTGTYHSGLEGQDIS